MTDSPGSSPRRQPQRSVRRAIHFDEEDEEDEEDEDEDEEYEPSPPKPSSTKKRTSKKSPVPVPASAPNGLEGLTEQELRERFPASYRNGGGGRGTRKGKGLVPDWIIAATCRTFGLAVPSAEQPRILGLCDPCANSLTDPNVPAEVLYTEEMDGLKRTNVWHKYVFLNPPFVSNITVDFVNRAIEEIEDDDEDEDEDKDEDKDEEESDSKEARCQGIIFLSRASTYSHYYAKIACYPHIFLRAKECIFKEYTNPPVGWGVALFLLAPQATLPDLTKKFFREFGHAGSAVLPFDAPFLETDAFVGLLQRQYHKARQTLRRMAVECSRCLEWHPLPPKAPIPTEEEEWLCPACAAKPKAKKAKPNPRKG